MGPRTRCSSILLAFASLPSCVDTRFIGATAEGGSSEAGGSTSGDATNGDSLSESSGAPPEFETGDAPRSCVAPCDWEVVLGAADFDFGGAPQLELDPSGAPVLLAPEAGVLVVQRLGVDGQPVGSAAALRDVPSDATLWSARFEIGPDGTVAIAWTRGPDEGFYLQRRSTDVVDTLWTVERAEGDDTRAVPIGMLAVDDGSLRVAMWRKRGSNNDVLVSAYGGDAAALWSASLDTHGSQFSHPELAAGPDGSLWAWARGDTDDGRMHAWRRDLDGTITELETATAGTMAWGPPTRRADGWIVAGSVEDAELRGIAMQRIDDTLTATPAAFDWPDAAVGRVSARALALLGDRTVVFAATGPDEVLQLRVYGLDGALQGVHDTGQLSPGSGPIYDVEVAPDGSLYAVGIEPQDGDHGSVWLRRFVL